MYKTDLTRIGFRLLLLCSLIASLSGICHAQTLLSRADVTPTGLWLEARKARYTGKPILLHLRTGHERALLMPEPVRKTNPDQQAPGYEVDISGTVVHFYPLSHFARQPMRLTGLDTGTEYVLQLRASAFGIRQPLQIFPE